LRYRPLLEALLLGIIQGATEFIPVSSTAHLILFSRVFDSGGVTDSLSFDVALHAGTLLAVVVYFFKDWLNMLISDRRMLFFVIAATVPAGLAGYLLNDVVDAYLRDPFIISFALIIIAIVMIIAEQRGKNREMHEMGLSDSLVIGFSQVLALIPGVSRSGITITAGLFRNMKRESAARFSFLLSTPIIGGAAALHLGKIASGEASFDMSVLVVGVVSSAVSGFIAIRFLMRFFRKYSLRSFAYYRIALGILIMVVLWTLS